MTDINYFIIRRIPLAQMYRGKLALGLECPGCGTKFTADYRNDSFSGDEGRCPQCGEKRKLAQPDLRRVLEKRFRSAARRIEAKDTWLWTSFLAFTIARAAVLLEPIFLVAVLKIERDRIGDFFAMMCGYLWHLETAGKKDALLFAVPPSTEANRYLTEKFGERFIITPAAAPAYYRLLKKPGFAKRALATLRKTYLRLLVRNPDVKAYLTYKWTKPFEFRHAHDLFNYEDSWYIGAYKDLRIGAKPLRFSPSEDAAARKWLDTHGIPGNNFVCFLGRDRAYMEQYRGYDKRVFRYHDYRNININDYLPAMNWLADQGVFSLRMGTTTQAHLQSCRKEIIDFASMGKNEFMDIYLTANCLFYVSPGSGPDQIAPAMGRPYFMCNAPYFNVDRVTQLPGRIYAPKKIWSHDKRRFLTIREMFELKSRCGFFLQSDFYEHHLALVDNDPTDVRDYVQEVYCKATKQWTISDEEKRVQERYHGLIREYHHHAPAEITATLCYSYYQRNPYLLSDA